MPDFDYGPVQAAARSLVDSFGAKRVVTLVQLDDTEEQPGKRWRGATNPRGVPRATLDVKAVNVEPSSLERLGVQKLTDDLLRRATKLLLVGGDQDCEPYHEALDLGERYRILELRELRPGDLLLLTILVLGR